MQTLFLLSVLQLFHMTFALSYCFTEAIWMRSEVRNFTWNRFPVKNFPIDSLFTSIVESSYLNIDTCKFESSQKDENSRMIPRKHRENLVLLSCASQNLLFPGKKWKFMKRSSKRSCSKNVEKEEVRHNADDAYKLPQARNVCLNLC